MATRHLDVSHGDDPLSSGCQKEADPSLAARRESCPRRASWEAVVLAVCCLVALGMIAGGLIVWDPPPPLLATPDDGGLIAVTQQEFDDAQPATLVVTVGSEPRLLTPLSGRLTASVCAVGSQVSSGQVIGAVDGLPVVGLATGSPLWRNLTVGDSGADVDAFIAELARLGVVAQPLPSRLTEVVMAAWRQTAIGWGVPASALPKDTVDITHIAWLASVEATVTTCDAAVGEWTTMGQPWMSFAPAVVSAQVMASARTIPAERIFTVGDLSLPEDDQGEVTDPSALERLTDSDIFRTAQRENTLSDIQGREALASPFPVSVLPPAAIVLTSDDHGCVVDNDGVVRSLSVVSSQLGQTSVRFATEPPAAVTISPPAGLVCS